MLSRKSMQMTAMLGLKPSFMARSCFSTMEPKVFTNAVFMPELFPARLTVPTAKEDVKYDFTCENQTKVADFRQAVLDNTEADVTTFDLLTADQKPVEESNTSLTMGELKAKKFKMRVNNKLYDVYPDMISISRSQSQDAATKHPTEMAKADDMDQSISIVRDSILKDYYGTLVAALKKEAGKTDKITEAQLQKALKASIKTYSDSLAQNSVQSVETLAELKQELAEQLKQRDEILRSAHKRAGMMLGVGALGATAQLVGFATGIYVISDWNEMEPWTFLFRKLYRCFLCLILT